MAMSRRDLLYGLTIASNHQKKTAQDQSDNDDHPHYFTDHGHRTVIIFCTPEEHPVDARPSYTPCQRPVHYRSPRPHPLGRAVRLACNVHYRIARGVARRMGRLYGRVQLSRVSAWTIDVLLASGRPPRSYVPQSRTSSNQRFSRLDTKVSSKYGRNLPHGIFLGDLIFFVCRHRLS